jgi:hypothetical protein
MIDDLPSSPVLPRATSVSSVVKPFSAPLSVSAVERSYSPPASRTTISAISSTALGCAKDIAA